MSDLWHPGQAAAIHILESWGLDPWDIALEGITAEGYLYFVRNGLGDKIIQSDDTLQVDFAPWPQGFPFDSFIGYVHNWQEAIL